jgi:ammonia channel protein AmtB
MLIAAIIVVIIYKMHYWVERRFKIDDAVGAVAVHGYAGFLGVCAVGFVLWGYPSSPDALLGHAEPWARVTPWGQFIGAVIMFWVLGFIPGYALSYILKMFGLLRVPREVELAGLDYQTQSVVVEEDREIIAVTISAGRAAAPAE